MFDNSAIRDIQRHGSDDLAWLVSYCRPCLAAGAPRLCALASPVALTWQPGWAKVITEYVCDHCGHRWHSTEWTAADFFGPEPLVCPVAA